MHLAHSAFTELRGDFVVGDGLPYQTESPGLREVYLENTRSLALEAQSQTEGLCFNDLYDTRKLQALGV